MTEKNITTRTEKDMLGTVDVPENAFYGANTQRAINNFPISGLVFHPSMITSLALVKKYAVKANWELGLLDAQTAEIIIKSVDEILSGNHRDQFRVDVFQTGSGTSTNMNMNEVIAGRANEMLTGIKGGKAPIHPNDHVNMGQSSNDVIPTSIHIAAVCDITQRLIPSLKRLKIVLSQKAEAFAKIPKIGRTHLQDAVPITLGDEFSGYARQVALGIKRLESGIGRLAELALGGTAVGNGLNTHPEFPRKVIEMIAEDLSLPFTEAKDHFEAQSAQDAVVETSGQLKTIAVSLSKMANDIRWLASGPRCGLSEITLPSLQPGSSIMPGKVNPVIPEAVIQIAAQVIGNDATITLGGLGGFFELNVMMPVIAYNLLQSIDILANGVEVFATKCVQGITANEENCRASIEKSLALVTHFVPHLGYDKAAMLAQKAYTTGQTVRDLLLEENLLPKTQIDEILTY